MQPVRYSLALFILLITLLSGCATNPVTGERQLMFSDFSDDVRIGKEQYKPALQSQGGEYYRDPALSAYVRQVGEKLAKVSDEPNLPYEFVILNNSVPNAWALPSGKIAINRGLLVNLETEAQLAAVLSHEIVHAAARHGAQRMRDQLLMQVGMAGLGLTLADNDYRGLIIGAASLGAGLTIARYSREHELESDHFGMNYMARAGYDPMGAVELQELFVKWFQGGDHSWIDGLFASHPPSLERVAENKKTAEKLKTANGRVGREEFQRAIAKLKADTEAYELADKAAEALEKNKTDQAEKLIHSALSKVQNEALFHSIKGEILTQEGKPAQALESHNKALALNPDQFSYYLNRAQTYEKLNRASEAIADYQASMNRLPTSVGALHLGQLHASQGQTGQARYFLAQAANASGQPGKDARRALQSLSGNTEQEQGVTVRHFRNDAGQMYLKIENTEARAIKGITLVSEISTQEGRVLKREVWEINTPIKARSNSDFIRIPVVDTLPEGQVMRTQIVEVIQTP